MHNTEWVLENKTRNHLWDFEKWMGPLISAGQQHQVIIKNKKKRTCWIVDFAVPTGNRVKLKESKKKDKYKDLAWELKKKLCDMKLIVIGAFGTVTKGLVQGLENLEIRGRVDTIQTTALLRSARILKRVLET